MHPNPSQICINLVILFANANGRKQRPAQYINAHTKPTIYNTMNKLRLVSSIATVLIALASCGDAHNEAKTSAGEPTAAAKPTGEDIYKKNCVACHQANGEGVPGAFPPLAKSDYLNDKEKTIAQVIKGSSGEITVNGKTFTGTMPAQQLNDEEVAAALTYVYGNLGNNGGVVTPAEVKAVRDKH